MKSACVGVLSIIARNMYRFTF